MEEVFTDFLGLGVEQTSSHLENYPIRSSVGIEGPWTGAVVVCATEDAAARVAAAMLGMEPDELEAEDVADCWGEVANLLAGSVIRSLPGGHALTTPETVSQTEGTLLPPHALEKLFSSHFLLCGPGVSLSVHEKKTAVAAGGE